jgi:Fic family protein
MTYNWQQSDWPHFRYNLEAVQDLLFIFAEKTGHISGTISAFSEQVQTETLVDFMVSEAINTSEIEGEYLSRPDVISSIRKNLGLSYPSEKIQDMRAPGISKLITDVHKTFQEPLTEKKLFEWHEMLLTLPNSLNRMLIGYWRTHAEAMQVVSVRAGRDIVHFEAPPSKNVPEEMEQFITWFNESAPGGTTEIKPSPVRAAITHLYFESIHPFEDGNGRIGRVLAEKALAQGLVHPPLLSLSKTIEANKKAYYEALKIAQRSNEITPWIIYFVDTLIEAQCDSEKQIVFTLKKTKFFDSFKDQLNVRQIKVLKRMLQEGPEGFEGGISAKKYSAITSISKATATRDLQELFEKGAIKIIGKGRSTRYEVNF